MIEIHRCNDHITIQGHANYAKPGEDIVCAGVSVLVQTLVRSVEELTTDKIEYDMQPGSACIKFWCLSDCTKVLIDAFFVGVQMIADKYPNNVKLTQP